MHTSTFERWMGVVHTERMLLCCVDSPSVSLWIFPRAYVFGVAGSTETFESETF